MLAAARAKLVSTSVPAITSALEMPSLPKWAVSLAVLGSLSVAASTTTSLPSAALADSAVRSASLRTFFGRACPWLRTTGPNALPPPRNCGAASLPWRARPVPFWAYIFLAVAVTSERPLVLCVPCWRRDSCHATLQDVLADRGAEHRIGEIDLAGAAALDGFDRDLHVLVLRPAAPHQRPP